MLRPTLVIGVGTSGLKIVEHVQKYMYEALGVNSLPIFRYLYIETDRGRDIEPTPLGSDITPLRAYVPKLQAAIDVLKANKNLELDWIPEGLGAQLSAINAGAGGVRPGGRLALWADKNFENIYRHIEKAFNDIVDPATVAKIPNEIRQRAGGTGIDTSPVIYVVGTLCGGTNAGMGAIDIGYMIRKITGMQDGGALYGIFLLPPDGQNMPAGYGNAYGALKEIEFFRDPAHSFSELWPNGVRGDCFLPPFGIVYLVSQEYHDESKGGISSLDGLYRTVGLQIFVNLLGMSNLRTSVLVDGLNQGFGFYSTFGISAVTHPRYSLSEYNACHAAIDLCTRWINTTHYVDVGGARTQINEPVARDKAAEFMDDVLKRADSLLEQKMGDTALINELQDDVEKILTKQIDSPQRYLHGKFTSGSLDGYFAIVRGNLRSVRDFIIEELANKATDELDKTQNLRMIELFLDGCRLRLQRTLALWAAMDVPKEAGQWNVYADGFIADLMLHTNRLVLRRKATLVDRLKNLLNDLKMFCMRDTLQELYANFEAGASVSLRDNAITLPTLVKIKVLHQIVQTMLKKLEDRKGRIFEEMKDTTVPIFRVWRGSFDADAESSYDYFRQQNGNERHAKEVANQPLFKFLDREEDDKIVAAAEELKGAYQKKTIEAIPPMDLFNEVANQIHNVQNYAERAQSGLLRLERGGTSGAGVPRFVISSSIPFSQRLIDELGKKGHGDFSKQQAAAIDFLKHMIIFYEEKAQVNPLLDLKIRETLRRNYEQAPIDRSGTPIMRDEIWRKMRLAYSLDRRSQEIDMNRRRTWVTDLIDLLIDFAVQWEPDAVTGDLQPQAVRSEFRSLNIALDGGAYPHCRISVPGKADIDLRLDRDDAADKKILSRERAHFDLFLRNVRTCVRSAKKETLLTIWNEEVRPRILDNSDAENANLKGQFYFGGAGKRGFVDLLLEEKKIEL